MAVFDELKQLMEFMRSPKGCPWDKKQRIADFKKYLREESDEAIEAIEKNDMENLKEELGDILWHVFFISEIAKENGDFTIDDVCQGLHDKIIRRHPHVFGREKRLDTAEDVEREWSRIKAQEHNHLDL